MEWSIIKIDLPNMQKARDKALESLSPYEHHEYENSFFTRFIAGSSELDDEFSFLDVGGERSAEETRLSVIGYIDDIQYACVYIASRAKTKEALSEKEFLRIQNAAGPVSYENEYENAAPKIAAIVKEYNNAAISLEVNADIVGHIAKLYLDYMQLQVFSRRSGTIGRLAINLLLGRQGLPGIALSGADMKEHEQCLEQYAESGDIKPMAALIEKHLIKEMQILINWKK